MASKVEIQILLKTEEAKRKLEEIDKEQQRVGQRMERRARRTSGPGGGGMLDKLSGGRMGAAKKFASGQMGMGALLLVIVALAMKIITMLGYLSKVVSALGFADFGAKLDQFFAGINEQQDKLFNLFSSVSQSVDIAKKFALSGHGEKVSITGLTGAFQDQAGIRSAEERGRNQASNVDLMAALVQAGFGSK